MKKTFYAKYFKEESGIHKTFKCMCFNEYELLCGPMRNPNHL